MNKYDVIVIGAGILGISHAYHLVKSGLKVALIEKNAFPEDATVRNFGQIVPSGMNLKWQKYGRESLKIYKDIQSEFDISVRQEGSIYLASAPEEMQLLEELAEVNKNNDYESILYTRHQCLQAYPGLKKDYVKGGLFFPQEINIDPRVAGRRIIEYCQQKYALQYIPNTLIKNVVRANGEVIITSSREHFLKASKVFVCTGSEFSILYPQLYSKSDLQIVKLQMLSTGVQPSQKIKGSILTGWTIRRYESFQECSSFQQFKQINKPPSFQQDYGIHILFKQNPDGSVIIGDSHEYASVNKPEQISFDINCNINEFMMTEAAKIFDLENYQVEKTWIGTYSQSTAQDLFEKTIDDHIHIVTGIGGKGMTASLGFAKKNLENKISLNNKNS